MALLWDQLTPDLTFLEVSPTIPHFNDIVIVVCYYFILMVMG